MRARMECLRNESNHRHPSHRVIDENQFSGSYWCRDLNTTEVKIIGEGEATCGRNIEKGREQIRQDDFGLRNVHSPSGSPQFFSIEEFKASPINRNKEWCNKEEMISSLYVVENLPQDYIPMYSLVDYSKANDVKKIRELVITLKKFTKLQDVEKIVNFRDSSGRTALSHACGVDSSMIIDELSKLKSVDPNLPDNEGNTPLHYAAQAGHLESLDMLSVRFKDAINLNSRNKGGLTPLMKAALQGRTRCAKALLSMGASSNLRDYSRNLTAAEWAKLCGRYVCSDLIVKCSKDNRKKSMSPPVANRSNYKNLNSRPEEITNVNKNEQNILHSNRNPTGGVGWLKSKIRKVIGTSSVSSSTLSSGNNNVPGIKLISNSHQPASKPMRQPYFTPTICSASYLVPNVNQMVDNQKFRHTSKKMSIPMLHVTPAIR